MTQDNPAIIESLAGSFLVSTMQMPDPRFEEQVILICAHNSEGSMGLAINKPSSVFSLAEVLRGADLAVPDKELPPIYMGGPVDMESAFIIYESTYRTSHQLEVTPTISVSRESKVLEDISKGVGPEKYMFMLGYTGWGPGQLEGELVDEGWLTVPGNDHITFDLNDEEKWKAAAMQYGIDISTYGDIAGFS